MTFTIEGITTFFSTPRIEGTLQFTNMHNLHGLLDYCACMARKNSMLGQQQLLQVLCASVQANLLVH
jgi:hypothetical protein